MKKQRKIFLVKTLLPLFFWILLTALPALAAVFFSSQNSADSGFLSLRVMTWLVPRFPFLSSLFTVSQIHKLVRKLAHFTLYFVLGSGLRGLLNYQRRVPCVPATILIGMLYAALDEFHQYFTRGRSASVIDVAIDTSGVIAGCAAVSLFFFLLTLKKGSTARALRLPTFWLFLTAFSILFAVVCSSLNPHFVASFSLRVVNWLARRFPLLADFGTAAQFYLLAHFTLYFFLGCGLRGLFAHQRFLPAAPAAVTVGTLCALFDEFHPLSMQGRGASATDVLMDTVGVIVGCATASFILYCLTRKSAGRPAL